MLFRLILYLVRFLDLLWMIGNKADKSKICRTNSLVKRQLYKLKALMLLREII